MPSSCLGGIRCGERRGSYGHRPNIFVLFAGVVPHLSLLAPVEDSADRANGAFRDGIAALGGAGEEEDFFLDVRGEVEEVHHVGGAGAGDVAEAGELRLVGDVAGLDQSVEFDGQRHQARDSGDVTAWNFVRRWLGWRRSFADDLAGSAAMVEMDLSGDGDSLAHSFGSWNRVEKSLMPLGRKVMEIVPSSPW